MFSSSIQTMKLGKFARDLGPVAQSIVSLTTSFKTNVNLLSTCICELNYQKHCYFLLEKCENLFDSHIF